MAQGQGQTSVPPVGLRGYTGYGRYPLSRRDWSRMIYAGANKRSKPTFAAAARPLRALPLGALAAPALVLGILDASVLSSASAVAARPNPGGATAPGGAGGKAPTGGTSKPTSSPHVSTVRITSVRCMPVNHCSTNPHQVTLHGTLLIAGKGIAAGLTIAFPSRPRARISSVSPGAHLRKTPAGAGGDGADERALGQHHGAAERRALHELVRADHGGANDALHPPAPAAPILRVARARGPERDAFEGQGMWIWYLSHSDGGNLAAIVAQAHAADVSAVFVKSSDGSTNYGASSAPNWWRNCTPPGCRCARGSTSTGRTPWARRDSPQAGRGDRRGLPGDRRGGEVRRPLRARRRHTSPTCARRPAPSYPLGLASFPYCGTTRTFPYSVFLGPNGAQFNRHRCTGRTSATRSTPSTRTPTSPTASTAARSIRSVRPTTTLRAPNWCAFARRRATMAQPASPGGTGRKRLPPPGPHWRPR